MKRIIIIVIAFFAAQNLFAQNILDEAEKAWYKADYFNAAKFYKQYITGEADSVATQKAFSPYSHVTGKTASKAGFARKVPGRVLYRLAESYRMQFDYTNAEPWYQQAAAKYNNEFPLAQYWYAVSLRANEKYTQAEEAINSFIASYKGADAYTDAAAKELKNLQFINTQQQKYNKDVYAVSRVESGLSTPGNFAAVPLAQNIVFTGIYTDSVLWKKKNASPRFNRLYRSAMSGNAVLLNIDGTNTTLNQGAAAFSPDGNQLYFTQWEKKGDKTVAGIYSASKSGENWSNVKKVDSVNLNGFNAMQPFVTADGKYLLFASDRPGGFGKYDLWYVELGSNGSMSTAINMGAGINTASDEQTPFYAQSINRLVFSSNGRTGMGGYDLFSAKGDLTKWETPVNMGAPINSVKDDQYFYSANPADIFSEAYFSSDRGSDCCLELYKAVQLPRNRTIVGTLLDCKTNKPLARGMIYLLDPIILVKLDSTFTDPSGKYILPVGTNEKFRLLATKASYYDKKQDLTVASLSSVDDINDVLTNKDICLDQQLTTITGEPHIIRDRVIYFDFDKQNLKPAAVRELDSMIVTLNENPKAVFEVGGYTDEKGTDEYNIKLGLRRANAAAAYLKAHGIAAERIVIKSYGKLYGAAGVPKEEAGKMNRKVRMVILSSRSLD